MHMSKNCHVLSSYSQIIHASLIMLISPAVNKWSFVLPYHVNISTWRRESIMSAIEKDALAPQFKSLNCALWCNTRVHCATRRECLCWQKMAVNLHSAHKKTDSRAAHEALLACSLPSCRTWIITSVQCTKQLDLRATHFVSHTCFDSSHDKIEEHLCVHRTWVST